MPLPGEERYTFADALTWDESERMELIEGVPVMMSPPLRFVCLRKPMTVQIRSILW